MGTESAERVYWDNVKGFLILLVDILYDVRVQKSADLPLTWSGSRPDETGAFGVSTRQSALFCYSAPDFDCILRDDFCRRIFCKTGSGNSKAYRRPDLSGSRE